MKSLRHLLHIAITAVILTSSAAAQGTISTKPFGTTRDGRAVTLYTLTNKRGMEVRIMNYGGIVVSLKTPDRQGKLGDVVLGYVSLAGYIKSSPYFGALVGRYANRIARGKFTLDGVTHQLAINNGPNSLHGGKIGFDKVIWQATPLHLRDGVGLALQYLSRNGEENYPGNLAVKVIYTLTNTNALKIAYSATTDRDTVLNLTNHSYFNLAGAGNGDILDHRLMINANRFTPIDASLIPTGALQSVAGTPLDFRRSTAIGARINRPYPQLLLAKGYDHNYVLNRAKGGHSLVFAARVYAPRSGRVLEVYTTQPGVQFYTGNFLDGSTVGKGQIAYKKHYGFCLETQHFPDSPNQPRFPTTELKPGQTYAQTTLYRFSTR